MKTSLKTLSSRLEKAVMKGNPTHSRNKLASPLNKTGRASFLKEAEFSSYQLLLAIFHKSLDRERIAGQNVTRTAHAFAVELQPVGRERVVIDPFIGFLALGMTLHRVNEYHLAHPDITSPSNINADDVASLPFSRTASQRLASVLAPGVVSSAPSCLHAVLSFLCSELDPGISKSGGRLLVSLLEGSKASTTTFCSLMKQTLNSTVFQKLVYNQWGLTRHDIFYFPIFVARRAADIIEVIEKPSYFKQFDNTSIAKAILHFPLLSSVLAEIQQSNKPTPTLHEMIKINPLPNFIGVSSNSPGQQAVNPRTLLRIPLGYMSFTILTLDEYNLLREKVMSAFPSGNYSSLDEATAMAIIETHRIEKSERKYSRT